MSQPTLSRIAEEICDFSGQPYEEVIARVERESLHPGIHVAEAWRAADPKTEREIERFYRTTDSYIYDLMVEGMRDIRQQWRDAILRTLKTHDGFRRVLDFGAGVGNETLFLASHGYEVTYYDLEGYTRDFALHRISRSSSRGNVKAVGGKSELAGSGKYDAIVCLEVLEHLTDPLETLSFLRDLLKPDGLIFLTQAFLLTGKDYPSHLPANRKLGITFEEDCFDLGLTIVDKTGPDRRIFVLRPIRPVDIIIPIYNGYDVLEACLQSIRRSADTRIPYRLVLIDDGSDDPRILNLLKESQEEDGSVVIHHDSRQGFAKSVNEGFSLSQHDVVILNSDTQVTPGWLTKLVRAAYRRRDIGTVTPLSNNASIFSLPIIEPLPPYTSVNEIGLDVESLSPNVYPQIPVGVGFCMFIKRDVIDSVGEFNAEMFGLGYGEEVDFCLRASGKGYLHILADDTYVYHRGAESFSKIYSNRELWEKRNDADRRLFALYPTYQQSIAEFKRKNPLGLHRALLHNCNALRLNGKPRVLFVVNNPIDEGFIGGIEFHVKDLIRHLGNDFAFYLLWCRKDAAVLDEYLGYSHSRFAFRFQQPLEPRMLFHHELRSYIKRIIRQFSINLIHIHHIMHGTLDALEMGHLCGIPVVVSIHDYYLICPNYNLLRETGEFCGIPADERGCGHCLAITKGIPVSFSVTSWREQISSRLMTADMLVFPSDAAFKVFNHVYEASPHMVIEHGIADHKGKFYSQHPEHKAERTRPELDNFSVCFLGYPAPQKGKYLMEQAVPRLVHAGITVHFLGSGAVDWPEEWQAFGDHVVFHGPYSRERVINVLRELSPHLVLLPSPWPETFGYVLSEAMAAGIPAVVSPLGALAERVRQTGAGVIMDEVSPEALVKAVLSIRDDPDEYLSILRRTQGAHLKSISEMAEEYRDLYSRLIERSGKIRVASPAASQAHSTAVDKSVRTVTPAKTDGDAPVGAVTWKSLVSIVIDCRCDHDLALRSIEMVKRNTRIPFELFLIRGGSVNGVSHSLEVAMRDEAGGVVVFSPPGWGFSYTINQILARSRCPYIVLMHGDVLVFPRWLEPLLLAIQQVDVGIVGPSLDYPLVDETKVTIFSSEDLADIEAYARSAAREKAGEGFLMPHVSDSCIVVKRSILDIIGGFDADYTSRSVAVSDFCLRARLSGYHAWVAQDSVVYHYGGKRTLCKMDHSDGVILRDSIRFRNKWTSLSKLRGESGYQESRDFPKVFSQEWYRYPLIPTEVAANLDDPLPLLESRGVLFLMCPEWDNPDDRWIDALRAYTSAFDHSEDVGLLIRVDPLIYPDVTAIAQKIERQLREAGVDLEGGWFFLVVNDPIPPSKRGRLYRTSQVFINTAPVNEFYYAAEEAKACGLLCCEPLPEQLRNAYSEMVALLRNNGSRGLT